MKIHSLFLIILCLGSIFISFSNASETTTIENNGIIMTITIVDAYYTALDPDGLEDDVVSHFTLNFESDNFDDIFYDLDISLILPSETSFDYHYDLSTSVFDLSYTIYFYNHATENGWYTVQITGTIFQGGYATDTVDFTFDPPGGTPGGNPLSLLILL